MDSCRFMFWRMAWIEGIVYMPYFSRLDDCLEVWLKRLALVLLAFWVWLANFLSQSATIAATSCSYLVCFSWILSFNLELFVLFRRFSVPLAVAESRRPKDRTCTLSAAPFVFCLVMPWAAFTLSTKLDLAPLVLNSWAYGLESSISSTLVFCFCSVFCLAIILFCVSLFNLWMAAPGCWVKRDSPPKY